MFVGPLGLPCSQILDPPCCYNFERNVGELEGTRSLDTPVVVVKSRRADSFTQYVTSLFFLLFQRKELEKMGTVSQRAPVGNCQGRLLPQW